MKKIIVLIWAMILLAGPTFAFPPTFGGGGDITSVGDCTSGACSNPTIAGTTSLVVYGPTAVQAVTCTDSGTSPAKGAYEYGSFVKANQGPTVLFGSGATFTAAP